MDESLESITQQTDASISTIHHILRAPRRRLVILLLANITTGEIINNPRSTSPEDVQLTVRSIAKRVVTIEQDVNLAHATGDAYHNVYTALTQGHLEHLDNVDAIEYDDDRKLIHPDQNLFAIAAVSAVTTPITRILFDQPVNEVYDRTS